MDWRESGQGGISWSMAGKDVTLSQLVLQINLLRNQVLGWEQMARLKRDSSNPSKPASSDIVKRGSVKDLSLS